MQKYTDAMMLDELRRVFAVLGRPFGRPLYGQYGQISGDAIAARFGGWQAALRAADLPAAWHAGGLQFTCPLCGASFRSDRSAKARRYCSDTCTRRAMSLHSAQYQGDAASEQAARGRTRKYRRAACEQCGAAPGGRRLHVHHRDENPYNNDPSNLITLCTTCHYAQHPHRATRRLRTHCPSGHPYAGDNLYVAPSGVRQCRACKREQERHRESRRRAAARTG